MRRRRAWRIPTIGRMEHFGPETYGERVADVYDEWYQPVDTAAEVALLTELAAGGRALELGIGTGRIALPLAANGVEVHGIEASPAMIAAAARQARWRRDPRRARRHGRCPRRRHVRVRVRRVQHVLPALLAGRAARAASPTWRSTCDPGGRFLVHAFVPDTSRVEAGEHLAVKEASLDRVRLDASVFDALEQRLDTTQVRITEQGIRLVHAKLRFAWPPELDLMAQAGRAHPRTPLVDASTSSRLPARAPSRSPSIAHDLTGRVQAGDAGHAAAAVGRAARLVQARDRRAEVGVAGRGPHVEHLVGRELAVEDVAADRARTRAPSRTARSPGGAGSSR